MTRPRVLLADDHALVLEGLRKLLQGACEVVGAVGDGRTLLGAAVRLRPDVILVDISMPLLNGIDAVRRLRTLVPSSKLVCLTMHADPTYAAEAFAAGAVGYLVKSSAPADLLDAIHTVMRGGRYVARALSHDSLACAPLRGDLPAGQLTQRQREVLQLVAEGRAAKEIATVLRISVKTVEFHKAQIMTRLHANSVAALTRYALRHGIIGS